MSDGTPREGTDKTRGSYGMGLTGKLVGSIYSGVWQHFDSFKIASYTCTSICNVTYQVTVKECLCILYFMTNTL